MLIMWLFKDSNTLGEESEALHVQEQAYEALQEEEEVETQEEPSQESQKARWEASVWVPRVCCTADMMFGIASGMTIKFFPLFFKEETKLVPSRVNIIFLVTPLLCGLFSLVLERVSRRFGRVAVALASKVVGVSLLFIMASMEDLWEDWFIIVPIYVVRTVLMNATSPLQKSILMDYVPKEQRGFYNSLESVTAFGWSGSAFLGGVIADRGGYGSTFYATACTQALALGILFFLYPLVPK